MPILDIHTHHVSPVGVLSLGPGEFDPQKYPEDQVFSVGIHPWSTVGEPTAETWELLEEAVGMARVAAVGECGVDLLKGGPMFRQLQVFRRQAELAERAGKPLMVHDVKAHDIIISLRKELKPLQPWVIHGFRGKPTVMKMLVDAGCMVSFGERFNPESLLGVGPDRYLAETDESPLPIEEIVGLHASVLGIPAVSLIEVARNNVRSLFR